MNYVLMLVILILCGFGYYEYTVYKQIGVADQQQISDLTGKIDPLTAENKKLTDDLAQANKTADDEKAQIATLSTQLQESQKELADATKLAAQAAAKAAVKSVAIVTAPTPPPSPNSLGTITTQDGKSYQNCQLLKTDADSITITCDSGITQLSFLILPPDLQKKFGYTPHNP